MLELIRGKRRSWLLDFRLWSLFLRQHLTIDIKKDGIYIQIGVKKELEGTRESV